LELNVENYIKKNFTIVAKLLLNATNVKLLIDFESIHFIDFLVSRFGKIQICIVKMPFFSFRR